MARLRILTIGKLKESWLQSALAEYEKRLTGTLQVEWVLAKNDTHLKELIAKEGPALTLLDEGGKLLSSGEFADFFAKQLQLGGATVSFVIGGPDGLPRDLPSHLPKISLSRMTFTHQMVRLILVEQVYRGLEILKGSHYHR